MLLVCPTSKELKCFVLKYLEPTPDGLYVYDLSVCSILFKGYVPRCLHYGQQFRSWILLLLNLTPPLPLELSGHRNDQGKKVPFSSIRELGVYFISLFLGMLGRNFVSWWSYYNIFPFVFYQKVLSTKCFFMATPRMGVFVDE